MTFCHSRNTKPSLLNILCLALPLLLAAPHAYAQDNTARSEVLEITPRVKSPTLLPNNMLTISFAHLDRSGEGHSFGSNNYTATLLQRITPERAQFFSFGFGATNAAIGADDTSDGDFASLSYGQLWASAAQPGLTYTLSAFGNRGRGRYANTFSADKRNSSSLGVIAGVAQAIPLTTRDSLQTGANLALAYAFVDGPDDEGAQATLYPFIQYNRVVTQNLRAYARMTATLSTEDVSITNDRTLYTPKVGLAYTWQDFTLGADYSYEFVDDHRGQRVGVSVSRAF